MTRRTVPNFVALWISDIHGSSAKATLSGEAYALYCAMLVEQPLIGGFPDDDAAIARRMRYPLRRARALLREIRPYFEPLDGLLVNPRMAEETAVALAKSAKQSARRKGSGANRGRNRGSTADTTAELPWSPPRSDRGTDQPEPEPEPEEARAPSVEHSAREPEHHPPAGPPPASGDERGATDEPPAGDDPLAAPIEALQANFLALRRLFDRTARPGKPSTWELPSRRLVADPERGFDLAVSLARWLFTRYRPERSDYDLRARVFTPYHLEQRWDELSALRLVQDAASKAAEPPETCSCGSRSPAVVNEDEDRLTCIHEAFLAGLRTVRCADCGALHDSRVSSRDTCRECAADGKRDRSDDIVRDWAAAAVAKARSRSPAAEESRP